MARAEGYRTGGNPENSGGKKGRSGRRPNEWKAWCGRQLGDPKVRQAIRKALIDPESRSHAAAVKLMVESVHGKPAQELAVHHDGKVEVVWEQPK